MPLRNSWKKRRPFRFTSRAEKEDAAAGLEKEGKKTPTPQCTLSVCSALLKIRNESTGQPDKCETDKSLHPSNKEMKKVMFLR